MLRVVDCKLGPDIFEGLGFFIYSPDKQGEGLSFIVFEGDYDFPEAQQAFEEVAGVNFAVVVFSANLLAAFGGAILHVQVIGGDGYVVEQSLEP